MCIGLFYATGYLILVCDGLFSVTTVFFFGTVWTLVDCEWRAVAPGLNPLRLPRARNMRTMVLTDRGMFLCACEQCCTAVPRGFQSEI